MYWKVPVRGYLLNHCLNFYSTKEALLTDGMDGFSEEYSYCRGKLHTHRC